MNKRLEKMIDSFLANKSKSDGGYAPVSERDILQLDEIIYLLLSSKYQKDPDGDLPINWTIVDRTRYESLHYIPVPHTTNKNQKEFLEAINCASTNASIATDRLRQLLSLYQWFVKYKRPEEDL